MFKIDNVMGRKYSTWRIGWCYIIMSFFNFDKKKITNTSRFLLHFSLLRRFWILRIQLFHSSGNGIYWGIFFYLLYFIFSKKKALCMSTHCYDGQQINTNWTNVPTLTIVYYNIIHTWVVARIYKQFFNGFTMM